MGTKHTPGPWIYGPEIGPDCTRIDDQKGKVIAAVKTRQITSWEHARPEYSWDEEGAANARLISSAPELLEALKLAKSIIGHPDDAASKLIDAAIAKATGSE